jgi:predicted transcriptional regulator
MLHKILSHLGVTGNAYRIYLRLLEKGPASARQLAENLNLPRPSVYDNLKLLIKYDLVVERFEENKKVFQIADVKNLSQLVQEKIDILQQDKREFSALLPLLGQQAKTIEPKIKFYAGAEGVKRVLRDMLWYENIETLTMWPISEMIEILGSDYLADLNRKRIKHGISIKGIWPKGKAVNLEKYPFLGIGGGHLRELRLAPSGMSWDMSYWLYADKVAFISSRNETFGFIVQSNDFVELIRAQFEVIWKLSKPIKPQPKYTDDFLKTV